MAISREEELYGPIKQFFSNLGYEVKGEVRHCDLVAYSPSTDEMIIVELKKTFNLTVLLQALERQRLSDKVYVAIERNRPKKGAANQRFSDLSELCRRLSLGLMTVTFYKTKAPLIEVLCEPHDSPIRRAKPKQANRLQLEFKERSGDYNVGGSQGTKLMTAYKEKALRIAICLKELEVAAPKDIVKYTSISQAPTMLRNNYYHWFEKVSRGKYKLSALGQSELPQYEHIITSWK